MIRAFLLGFRGGGGEEVFVRSLVESPPPGVEYSMAMDHHQSVDEARALPVREVLFNRIVHPFLWPLPGLRAYAIDSGINLVHVHNFPTWLRLPDACPVVYSVGGGTYAHYLEAYLGWSAERIRARYRRGRRVDFPLGIPSGVYYPKSLHQQPAYAECPRAADLGASERLCGEVLSLPMHPYLDEEVQGIVVDALTRAV